MGEGNEIVWRVPDRGQILLTRGQHLGITALEGAITARVTEVAFFFNVPHNYGGWGWVSLGWVGPWFDFFSRGFVIKLGFWFMDYSRDF